MYAHTGNGGFDLVVSHPPAVKEKERRNGAANKQEASSSVTLRCSLVRTRGLLSLVYIPVGGETRDLNKYLQNMQIAERQKRFHTVSA